MIFLVAVSFLSKGANWTGVELDEFMDCPYNLAHNRQTRMLADLTLAGCYTGYNSTEDQLERDRILLQSAKQNLAKMAYFGLTEQQSASQYIFEQTFQLDFANSFDQANATLSAQAIAELTPSQVIQSSFPTFWSSFLVTNHVVNMNPRQLERIRQLNSLDTQLLDFARQLLQQRFEELKRRDPYFRQHWLRILRPFKSETPDDNSVI